MPNHAFHTLIMRKQPNSTDMVNPILESYGHPLQEKIICADFWVHFIRRGLIDWLIKELTLW